jgi:hypothetical protein
LNNERLRTENLRPATFYLCPGGRFKLYRDLQIERFLWSAVERTMRRLKFMLVALLPVLGLTAAGFSYFGAAVRPESSAYSLSVSAGSDSQGRHDAAADFSACDQIARGLNRRAGVQPGEERLASPVSGSVQPAQARQPQFTFYPTERSLELARSWQFHWRAAGEPRAPSAVS